MARAEYRLHMAGTAWRVSVSLSILLAILAALTGMSGVERHGRESALLANRRADAAQHGRHMLSGFQQDEALRVIRPQPPTALLVGSADSAQYADMGPEGITAGVLARHQTNAATNGVGLDLEFILRGLMGLLAVVVGAGSLVTARHRSTTKVLVSLPVSPVALVAGALMGGFAAIVVGTGLVIIAALITVAVVESTLLTAAVGWSALMLWMAAALAGAALQGAGAIVALWARTAAGALTGAVGFWLVSTVVAIPAVNALATAVAPLPVRAFFEAERLAQYQAHITQLELAAGEIVTKDPASMPVAGALRLEGATLREVDALWTTQLQHVRGALDRMEADLDERELRQERWRQWLAAPLTGAVFRSAAMELTGAGAGAAARWQTNLRDQQRALNTALFDERPRIHVRLRRPDGLSTVYAHDRGPRPAVADLPAFAPGTASARDQLRDATLPLLQLGAHAALTWLAALMIFVRRQGATGDWN